MGLVAESQFPASPLQMTSKEIRARMARGRARGSSSDMNKYLMVGIGGFVGSVLRFWLGGVINGRFGTRFPFGTFVVNCTGSFLVGFVMALLAERGQLDSAWRYLVPIGFIGGYTTFSAFEYETLRSVQDGEILMASLNVCLSVVVGFFSAWLGVIAGKRIA
jgi:fluoride exporter